MSGCAPNRWFRRAVAIGVTALGFYAIALPTKPAEAQFVSVPPGVVVDGGWGWGGPCWGCGRFFFHDGRFFHECRFFFRDGHFFHDRGFFFHDGRFSRDGRFFHNGFGGPGMMHGGFGGGGMMHGGFAGGRR
jgi:hypothetical protein